MTKKPDKKFIDITMNLVFVLFIITFVHHIYGGIIYNSMERTMIAIVFAIALVSTFLLYKLSKTRTWARYSYWFIVFLGWVGIIGLIEGGFNHVVKVGLWATGTDPKFLYDPKEYEPPTDLFFEVTGILTLLPAIIILGIFIKNKFLTKDR